MYNLRGDIGDIGRGHYVPYWLDYDHLEGTKGTHPFRGVPNVP